MRRVTREVTREVMSNMNWIILALLAVTMTAVAQEPASAPQNPQPVAATPLGQTTAQPSAAPSGQAQSAQSQSPQAQASLAPPTNPCGNARAPARCR